jgi:hypothetical protein
MTRISFNGGRVLSIKYNERGLYLRHGLVNSSTNINKSNHYLSHQLVEHIKDNAISRWKSRSWIGTGIKMCRG